MSLCICIRVQKFIQLSPIVLKICSGRSEMDGWTHGSTEWTSAPLPFLYPLHPGIKQSENKENIDILAKRQIQAGFIAGLVADCIHLQNEQGNTEVCLTLIQNREKFVSEAIHHSAVVHCPETFVLLLGQGSPDIMFSHCVKQLTEMTTVWPCLQCTH